MAPDAAFVFPNEGSAINVAYLAQNKAQLFIDFEADTRTYVGMNDKGVQYTTRIRTLADQTHVVDMIAYKGWMLEVEARHSGGTESRLRITTPTGNVQSVDIPLPPMATEQGSAAVVLRKALASDTKPPCPRVQEGDYGLPNDSALDRIILAYRCNIPLDTLVFHELSPSKYLRDGMIPIGEQIEKVSPGFMEQFYLDSAPEAARAAAQARQMEATLARTAERHLDEPAQPYADNALNQGVRFSTQVFDSSNSLSDHVTALAADLAKYLPGSPLPETQALDKTRIAQTSPEYKLTVPDEPKKPIADWPLLRIEDTTDPLSKKLIWTTQPGQTYRLVETINTDPGSIDGTYREQELPVLPGTSFDVTDRTSITVTMADAGVYRWRIVAVRARNGFYDYKGSTVQSAIAGTLVDGQYVKCLTGWQHPSRHALRIDFCYRGALAEADLNDEALPIPGIRLSSLHAGRGISKAIAPSLHGPFKLKSLGGYNSEGRYLNGRKSGSWVETYMGIDGKANYVANSTWNAGNIATMNVRERASEASDAMFDALEAVYENGVASAATDYWLYKETGSRGLAAEVIYNPLSGVRNGVPNMVSVDRRYDYSRSKKAVLKKTEGAYTLLNWSVDSTGRPVPGSRYKAIDKSFCADGSIFETVAQTVEIDGGGGVAGTTDYTRTPGNTTNCIW